MGAPDIDMIVTDQDFDRLLELMRATPSRGNDLLANQLALAKLVAQKEAPPDVVTMNSVVQLVDEKSGAAIQIALVYPQRAEPSEGRISVLAPLGVKLLGLRIGQSVDWPTPKGAMKVLKISELLFQPEAAGAWDL